jgi:hypothetical protein
LIVGAARQCRCASSFSLLCQRKTQEIVHTEASRARARDRLTRYASWTYGDRCNGVGTCARGGGRRREGAARARSARSALTRQHGAEAARGRVASALQRRQSVRVDHAGDLPGAAQDGRDDLLGHRARADSSHGSLRTCTACSTARCRYAASRAASEADGRPGSSLSFGCFPSLSYAATTAASRSHGASRPQSWSVTDATWRGVQVARGVEAAHASLHAPRPVLRCAPARTHANRLLDGTALPTAGFYWVQTTYHGPLSTIIVSALLCGAPSLARGQPRAG